MKCCVYTRFVYDVSYLDFFIEHYLKLGFDMIYVLYYDYVDYILPDKWKDFVTIIEVENEGNKLPDKYFNRISQEMDWVLNIDSDEFLYLHKKYKNIQDFVKKKIKEHSKVNVFQFSWAWVHKFSCNNTNGTLLFQDYKKTIGFSVEQKFIYLKSMFKRCDVKSLSCHSGELKQNIKAKLILNGKYKEIKDNIIPSFQNYKETIYDECVLYHVNTRDFINAIFKSVHIHGNQSLNKRLKDIKLFKDWIEFNDTNKNIEENVQILKKSLGFKIEFPFHCLNIHKNITQNHNFNHFPIYIYNTPFCSPYYFYLQIQNLKKKLESIARNQYYSLNLDRFVTKVLNTGEALDKLYFIQ